MAGNYKKVAICCVLLLFAHALCPGCRGPQVEDDAASAKSDDSLEGMHLLTVTSLGAGKEPEPGDDAAANHEPHRFEVVLLSARKFCRDDLTIRKTGTLTGMNEEEQMLLVSSESPSTVLIRKRKVEETGRPTSRLCIGTLITDGVLLSAKVDSYDAAAEEGTLSGRIAVAQDGLVVLDINLEEQPFNNGEPILFMPQDHTLPPPAVPDEKVHRFEGMDSPIWEEIFRGIAEGKKSAGEGWPKTSQRLRVSLVWEGEDYCLESLRKGIRKKVFYQQFRAEFQHRRSWLSTAVTHTPSITVTKTGDRQVLMEGEEDMSYLRITEGYPEDPLFKVLIVDGETRKPSIGELVFGGTIIGIRVDTHDTATGKGTVSGELISVDNYLLENHIRWEKLGFEDGEWIHIGGIDPDMLERLEHEEQERRIEEFMSRRTRWFW